MAKKTIEERAELKKVLDGSRPALDAMRADAQTKAHQWDEEIAMLERRMVSEYAEVELSGKDTIAVRTCLSETESSRLGELYTTWFSPLKNPDANAIAHRRKIGYEIIALVTANPLITEAWLEANPDRFSTDDAVNILISWIEQRRTRENERVARLVSVTSFRPEPAGSELREFSQVPGNKRPS
jgi:hypothetical protein